MFKNKILFFDFNIKLYYFPGKVCKEAKERLLL